jgi:hypothetical protein
MLHGLNSCGEGKVLSYKKGSLKFFLYHSFSSLSLSSFLPHPASLNASMMNAQDAPILKALRSRSLRLLVAPGLA